MAHFQTLFLKVLEQLTQKVEPSNQSSASMTHEDLGTQEMNQEGNDSKWFLCAKSLLRLLKTFKTLTGDACSELGVADLRSLSGNTSQVPLSRANLTKGMNVLAGKIKQRASRSNFSYDKSVSRFAQWKLSGRQGSALFSESAVSLCAI